MQSPEDFMGDAVERLEWDERKEEDTPPKRLKQVTRRTALTGGAAGIAALALQACGGSSSKSSTAKASTGGGSVAASVYGQGAMKFTMVNHVTTNVFFTPTQNGASDACKLLNSSYTWTGSDSSNVSDMVNSINAAIASGVDGIATSIIAQGSFNSPIAKALAAKIPVIAYNANEPTAGALAYVGQSLFDAGVDVGNRIVQLLPSGGEIGLFIATPGAANIQPRLNGIESVLKSHSSIKYTSGGTTTGAAVPAEVAAIQSWAVSHPSAKGLFAVDGGSTQGCAQAIQKLGLRKKGVKGGGFDLTPVTEKLLSVGDLDFTIDQQPYLQGFLPILELYLYKASNGLTGPADVETGIKFVTQSTVGPYVSTSSRFEGTSSSYGIKKS